MGGGSRDPLHKIGQPFSLWDNWSPLLRTRKPCKGRKGERRTGTPSPASWSRGEGFLLARGVAEGRGGLAFLLPRPRRPVPEKRSPYAQPQTGPFAPRWRPFLSPFDFFPRFRFSLSLFLPSSVHLVFPCLSLASVRFLRYCFIS